MSLRYLWVVLFMSVCPFCGCSEKLPEGPGTELEDVLTVQLTMDFEGYAQENNYRNEYEVPDGMTWREFNILTAWLVYFRVRVENVFDEPVVGTKYIDAKIKIWDKNDTTKIRTLTVLDTLSTETLIIQPGETYTVFSGDRFIWDHTDDQGESFTPKVAYEDYSVVERIEYDKNHDTYFRHCDTLSFFMADSVVLFHGPIEIGAQATIQLFREFVGDYWQSEEVEFTIEYLSPEGWTPVNPQCKEGYVIEGP
jgi:hypothetical protein